MELKSDVNKLVPILIGYYYWIYHARS